jgi:uncharacterized membrane protein YkvA (DUF1232 family)
MAGNREVSEPGNGGAEQPPSAPEAVAEPATDDKRILAILRRATRNLRHRQLDRLHESRQMVFEKLREIPDRMQKLTNRVRLLLDLVDDYWAGRYRRVRWYTLAVAVAAALYFISPTDLIPDAIPGIGQLDDVLAVAIALRLIRADLVAYCEFRGLDPAEYF